MKESDRAKLRHREKAGVKVWEKESEQEREREKEKMSEWIGKLENNKAMREWTMVWMEGENYVQETGVEIETVLGWLYKDVTMLVIITIDISMFKRLKSNVEFNIYVIQYTPAATCIYAFLYINVITI